MKKPIKIFIIIIIGIGILAGIFYSINKPIKVEMSQIEEKLSELYFIEEGTVENNKLTEVFPLVSGEITDKKVKKGDVVKKGDIICVVNSTSILNSIQAQEATNRSIDAQISNLALQDMQRKDQLKIEASQIEGEITKLDAQKGTSNISTDEQIRMQNILVNQAKTELDRANDTYDNTKILFDSGVISQKDLNDTIEYKELAMSSYNQSLQQLELIKNGSTLSSEEYYNATKNALNKQLTDINLQINKDYTNEMKKYYTSQIEAGNVAINSLNDQLNNYTIKATEDGIIENLPIEETNVVNQGVSIATIKVKKDLEVETYISTKDYSAIKIGDTVEITLISRDGDKIVSGIIKEIENSAVEKVNNLGIAEKKVKVFITPTGDNIDYLKQGFSVDVKFIVFRKENSIEVPKTAVYGEGDMESVFVVSNGKAVKTKVKKGIELRTDYIIEEGLKNGDIIITDAFISGLKNGTKVE